MTDTATKPTKREKHPIEPGWVTPSDFCVYVNFYDSIEGMKLEAPNVHSIAKREDFPASREHSDGRLIMNLDDSIEWFQGKRDELAQKAAEREANKANREVAKVRSIAKTVAVWAKSAGV